MKIAIDFTSIPGEKTGVGKYAESLLNALENFDDENEYWIFIKKSNNFNFQKKEKFNIVFCSNFLNNKILRTFWEQVILPFYIYKEGINTLHSIHYTTSFFAPCKKIITFHDMTFFLFPEKHEFIKKVFFRSIIPISARKADRLIAVSQNTKKDIHEILSIPTEKIDVVYLTADSVYRPISDRKKLVKIIKKYRIRKNFILYVGTLEPRKNINNLLLVYDKLNVETRKENQLVIVGKKGWHYQEMFKTVNSLKSKDRIIFTGYVPEEELVFLYNAADIFVYPSLYEGFGIPPLEAMACGTPVITSNISSIPEVVNGAAILVNPHKIEEIEKKINELLNNKNLQEKIRLKGLKRAQEFSAEKLAKGTVGVYKKVTY